MQSHEAEAHDKVLDNNPDRIGILKFPVKNEKHKCSLRLIMQYTGQRSLTILVNNLCIYP